MIAYEDLSVKGKDSVQGDARMKRTVPFEKQQHLSHGFVRCEEIRQAVLSAVPPETPQTHSRDARERNTGLRTYA